MTGVAPQEFAAATARRLADLAAHRVMERIWAKDPAVWGATPSTPELRDRLGWLTIPTTMEAQTEGFGTFANEVRAQFERVVLCGMGGSSLAALALQRIFGSAPGFPKFIVLDSTDPRAVAALERSGDIARTLFLISSKSGTTLETDCFLRYFWDRTGGQGSQFVALTDPGTALATHAVERGFRKVFLTPREIGGRYSALSQFGLIPAALMGIDLSRLLDRVSTMMKACAATAAPQTNPAALLGAVLGEGAVVGRDKVTITSSPGIPGFGLWAEQLVAESTGKDGLGLVPIVEEPLGPPDAYGDDRLFIGLTLATGDHGAMETRLAALAAAGHPVTRLTMHDVYDLGAEFFRWELATAVAGAVLRINPFDQPNVAESKSNTDAVLRSRPALARAASRAELDAFLEAVEPGSYLALMAYLPPTPENDRRLTAIRLRLRDRFKIATTIGYGPRLLHSTGQLHKGGPPRGYFLQITEPPPQDLAIPGQPFTFGELEAAQAEGDLLALRKRGRPTLRVEGLGLVATALEA